MYFAAVQLRKTRLIILWIILIVIIFYAIANYFFGTEKFDEGLYEKIAKTGVGRDSNPCNESWSSGNTVWMIETKYLETVKPLIQCEIESYVKLMPEVCLRLLLIDPSNNIPQLMSEVHSVLGRDLTTTFHMVHMSAEDLFRSTPIASIWPKMSGSRFSPVHLAAAARVVLLYKFGGMYTDSDVILMRRPTFGPKFLTRSASSPTLMFAIFAHPKHDPLLLSALEAIAANYESNAYTGVSIHYHKRVQNFCRTQCGISHKRLYDNKTSFMCCDMQIVASALGHSGREMSLDQAEKAGGTFYHYARSFLCLNHKNKDTDLQVKTSDHHVAQVARKYCPITVENHSNFVISCENLGKNGFRGEKP